MLSVLFPFAPITRTEVLSPVLSAPQAQFVSALAEVALRHNIGGLDIVNRMFALIAVGSTFPSTHGAYTRPCFFTVNVCCRSPSPFLSPPLERNCSSGGFFVAYGLGISFALSLPTKVISRTSSSAIRSGFATGMSIFAPRHGQ